MRVVIASALAGCACNFAVAGFVPLAPFIVPRDSVGWLLSLQGIFQCGILVFVGPIVDRVGSEVVLWRGMTIQLVSTLVTASSVRLEVQILGRIAAGIAGSTVFNACISFVMDNFQEPARAKHVGTVLGMTMMGGLLGTPAVSSAYAAAEGAPLRLVWAFLPAVVLQLVAFAALLAASAPARPAAAERLLETPAGGGTSFCRALFGVYVTVGLQAWLLAAILAICFCICSSLQCAAVLELHARGSSAATIGAIFVPNLFVQALASPWAGHMSDSPRRRRYLLLGSLALLAGSLGAVASLPLGLVGTIMVALVAGSLATAIIDAPSISLMSELAALHGCGNGEAVTASELAVTLGMAVGPFVGQSVLQVSSFSALCAVQAAAASTLAVLAAAGLGSSVDPDACSSGETV